MSKPVDPSTDSTRYKIERVPIQREIVNINGVDYYVTYEKKPPGATKWQRQPLPGATADIEARLNNVYNKSTKPLQAIFQNLKAKESISIYFEGKKFNQLDIETGNKKPTTYKKADKIFKKEQALLKSFDALVQSYTSSSKSSKGKTKHPTGSSHTTKSDSEKSTSKEKVRPFASEISDTEEEEEAADKVEKLEVEELSKEEEEPSTKFHKDTGSYGSISSKDEVEESSDEERAIANIRKEHRSTSPISDSGGRKIKKDKESEKDTEPLSPHTHKTDPSPSPLPISKWKRERPPPLTLPVREDEDTFISSSSASASPALSDKAKKKKTPPSITTTSKSPPSQEKESFPLSPLTTPKVVPKSPSSPPSLPTPPPTPLSGSPSFSSSPLKKKAAKAELTAKKTQPGQDQLDTFFSAIGNGGDFIKAVKSLKGHSSTRKFQLRKSDRDRRAYGALCLAIQIAANRAATYLGTAEKGIKTDFKDGTIDGAIRYVKTYYKKGKDGEIQKLFKKPADKVAIQKHASEFLQILNERAAAKKKGTAK